MALKCEKIIYLISRTHHVVYISFLANVFQIIFARLGVYYT